MQASAAKSPITSRYRATLNMGKSSATAAAAQRAPHKWQVNASGQIVGFDMKTLRSDILFRIQTGNNLYTIEECRVFVLEIARVATRWQEEELANLQYLAELHSKVLPGRQVVYQWPPMSTPVVPFCVPHDQLHDNPLYKVTKVVEELNRSIVRMIDKLWNDRRERLLLAARILKDLEAATVHH